VAYETNIFLTRKFVSVVVYSYNSDKTNGQKSEIATKIDVYSNSRAHRRVSCSAECWGDLKGLSGSDRQHTAINLLKMSWAPSNFWNFIL